MGGGAAQVGVAEVFIVDTVHMSISRPEPDSYILMQVQHQARTRLQGKEGIIVAIALEVALVLIIVADPTPAYKAMDAEMNQFAGSDDELQQEAAVTESQIRAIAPFHSDLGGQTVAAHTYHKSMIDDPASLAANEDAVLAYDPSILDHDAAIAPAFQIVAQQGLIPCKYGARQE
jgi:hypothetical protein